MEASKGGNDEHVEFPHRSAVEALSTQVSRDMRTGGGDKDILVGRLPTRMVTILAPTLGLGMANTKRSQGGGGLRRWGEGSGRGAWSRLRHEALGTMSAGGGVEEGRGRETHSGLLPNECFWDLALAFVY